jgi:hypothetical protein
MQIESTNIGTYRVRYLKQKPAASPAPKEQSQAHSPFAALLKQKLAGNEEFKRFCACAEAFEF